MPSSSRNPFDDDCDNNGGGGGRKVVNHYNPFVDDSEEGSRKATQNGNNPFDSDDGSGFKAIQPKGRCPDDVPVSPIKHEEDYGQFEPLSPKEKSEVLQLELDMLAHQRAHRLVSFTTSSNQESIDGRETAWTPTTNLPLDDSSHSQLSNQPPTGKNTFDNRRDELERASSVSNETETTQKSNSSQVSTGNNSCSNTSGGSLKSGSDEHSNNSTKDSERESSAAVTDGFDNSSSSNNNSISSVERDYCDESDSAPDEILVDDEEAQVFHQTNREEDTESVASDAKSQAGDEHSNESDVKEAEISNNADDENVRQDMPQSKLFLDEQIESSNPLPDETKEEETTTPLLQNKEDSYWNKEGIRDAVASFDARCVQEVDEMKQDVENPVDERSLPRESKVMRSSIRRKKVKNRYCKACVMVTLVWGTMIILLSIALGMDWMGVNERLDQTNSESLCTLCGENSGFGINFSAYTLRPTRKPSSFVGVATIKPPPANIAEVCAPSIFLDHGTTKIPSVENLAASCATACLPAACCVVENNQARQALITMLESQGMGVQAATLFSTIEGCNRGDNVAICDSYNDFCSSLYDMKHALDTLPKNLRQSCNNEAESTSNSISTAFSRQYDSKRMSEECNEICLPLACCYETIEPTFVTERKRKRQHSVDYTHTTRRTTEFRQIGESSCDSFSAPAGSLNAEICNAYSPFCSSQDLNETVHLIPRTFVPTSTPSFQSSDQLSSSYQPTTQAILSPTNLVGSSEPSLIPSSKKVESPTSHPTTSSSPITGSVNTTSSPSNAPSLAPSFGYMTNSEPFIPNTTKPSLFPTLMPTTYNTSSAATQSSHLPTMKSSYTTPNSSSLFPTLMPTTYLPTMSSYPTPNSSSIINTSTPSSFPTSASNIDSTSSYPTPNSSSIINTSKPSLYSTNASNIDSTISSLPTREVNKTHNSSFPSMMPSANDRSSTESSSPTMRINTTQP